MTSLRTLTEKESKQDVKFDIKITEFYLEYNYKGIDHCIRKDDLEEFFSIYLVGIND